MTKSIRANWSRGLRRKDEVTPNGFGGIVRSSTRAQRQAVRLVDEPVVSSDPNSWKGQLPCDQLNLENQRVRNSSVRELPNCNVNSVKSVTRTARLSYKTKSTSGSAAAPSRRRSAEDHKFRLTLRLVAESFETATSISCWVSPSDWQVIRSGPPTSPKTLLH